MLWSLEKKKVVINEKYVLAPMMEVYLVLQIYEPGHLSHQLIQSRY